MVWERVKRVGFTKDVALALALILGQALMTAARNEANWTYGVYEFTQIALDVLSLYVAFQASRRSKALPHFFWRLAVLSFVFLVLAEALGTITHWVQRLAPFGWAS